MYGRLVLDELVKNGAANFPYLEIHQDASCTLVLDAKDAEKVLKMAKTLIESDRTTLTNGQVRLTSCFGLRTAGIK